jgi:hypothetical protein
MNIFEGAIVQAATPLCRPFIPFMTDQDLPHQQGACGNEMFPVLKLSAELLV